MIVKNAIWGMDYDMHTDECYKCPCCPECEEPVWKYDDGNYRCFSCREIVSITDEMQEWFKLREETKVEYHDCHKIIHDDGTSMGCDGKKCVETHYRRNPVTLEWQTCWRKCSVCGMKFIV